MEIFFRQIKNNYIIKHIILSLYIASLVLGIYSYSMVNWANKLASVRRVVIFLLGIISLILLKHTLKQYLFFIIGFCITSYSIIVNHGSLEYLLIVIIIFSLSTINPKTILKYSTIFIFINLLILFICSKLGIISNLLFYRDGTLRQSLGTVYPLAFAGYVFFLCAAYISINYDKNKIFLQILILLSSSLFLLKINGARNDSLFILLMVLCVFSVYIPKKINKIMSTFGSIVIFSLSILSIFITKLIPYTTNIYSLLNATFNGRLQFQYMIFNYYKPKLFGQLIPEVGLGGMQTPILNYFYIDNSYVKLLFMSGILFTILIYLTLIFLIKRLIDNNMYKLVYVLLVIMLAGIIEDSFINSSMNVFFTIFITSGEMLATSFKSS